MSRRSPTPLASPLAVRIAAAIAVAIAATALTSCADGGGIARKVTTTTRATATTTTTTAPAVVAATAGAADLADAITPGAGNGGYDVAHYDLSFDVNDARTSIDAVTTITATATQDLSSFDLDLRGLDVSTVTVDDTPATFTRTGDELVVTPKRPLARTSTFVTKVSYSGSPQPVPDPSAPGTIGWLSAPSGIFVASEPVGAKGFYPCNDHPSDKATFTISVTAADADTVAANGLMTKKAAATAGHTRWTFDQTTPMATYLVQIAVGDYDVITSTGPHGLTRRDVVVRSIPAEQRKVLGDTDEQITFFESLFGPFPFDVYGVLVADADPSFALETQTLTLIPSAWLSDNPAQTSAVMAHELAHEWFGDAVSVARWGDIWLNEGFATYAEWLWNDHTGDSTLDASVRQAMQQAQSWRSGFGAVLDPQPRFLFASNVYGGAAVVLQALRKTVGDDVFFSILRTWVTERSGTSATTADFQALASKLAGTDLTGFFDAWLRSTTLPPMPG
ncbi:MAG: M1 family metallopeptidase [Acidimicrobiales bacterium]